MNAFTEPSGENQALSCTARLDAAISDTNKRLSEARGRQIMARETARAILDGQLAGEISPGKDMVNRPDHYTVLTSDSGDVIEARHIIEAVIDGDTPMVGMQAHDIACTLKYLLRLGKKDDSHQDLAKSAKYLGWALQRIEGAPDVI